MLKINEKFAKKYDEYRRKEELQKFKDKFGDVTLSEAKRRLGERGGGDSAALSASPSSSASSSSESDDSDCEAWTPGMEAGFLRVYSALQAGDSRLYDASVSWFPEEPAGGGEGEGEGEVEGEAPASGGKEKQKAEKHKPMYYNEYHRKFLLAGAYQTEDDDTSAAAAAAEAGGGGSPSDMREAEMIRKSLADAHAKDSDNDDASKAGDPANGDDDVPFLVKKSRKRTGDRSAGDCGDPMAKLHRFVSAAGDETTDDLELDVEPQCKRDLAKLRRHWTNEAALSESERYLRDYVTKEFWRQPPPQQLLRGRRIAANDSEGSEAEDSADGEGGGGEGEQLSEDEAFLARQSEFESRWNLRTEGERDPEFESGYRRTFASGENCADNEDDDDDEELFVAKKSSAAGDNPDPDDAADEGVLEELRRLEKRRQWKLDSADDEVEEGEENAAAAAGRSDGGCDAAAVRSYPRRIAESLRQATAEGERARRRAELRERRRQEKLSRRRELDRLVAMKEAEVEKKLERLRRNAGLLDKSGGAAAAAFGGDFLEADFDPAEHDKRMAGLFGEQFYHPGEGEGEGEGEGGDEAKPVFSDDDWDGEADADEEARRLREEADRMCAEDLIRAGPGEADVKCRFNYRQTEPNDFGLSAVEILLADDRELNAWCSLRKASQYREREADRRDRRRYRSARVQERKDLLMPGLARRLEAAAACASAEDFAAAAAATAADPADALAATAASAAPGDAKKRRRKKKKKQQKQQHQESGSQEVKDSASAAAADTPRCRKKAAAAAAGPAAKKMKLEDHTGATATMSSHDSAKKQKKKKKSKFKSGGGGGSGDRLQISEQRLLELGIDPKKFRRMRREANSSKRESRELNGMNE